MDVIMSTDPGATSGYAVLSVGLQPKLLICKAVTWPKPGTPKDLPVNTPHGLVGSVIDMIGQQGHTIIGAAIEDQYLGLNADTLKKLARNGGRWEEAYRCRGIPVSWVAPASWQARELGTSRIERAEVKRRCMVKVRGLWNVTLKENEADAAIIGRYHAIRIAFARLRNQAR